MSGEMLKFKKVDSISLQNEFNDEVGSAQIEHIVHTVPLINNENSSVSLLTITSRGHIRVINNANEPPYHQTTYQHILTTKEVKQIQSSQYVKEISTFFIQLEKQTLLLNTSNLSKYDRINERNPFKSKLYSFQMGREAKYTVLIYACAAAKNTTKSVLLKCFLWDNCSGQYKTFKSQTLEWQTSKDYIKDINVMPSPDDNDKVAIMSSRQVSVWNVLSDSDYEIHPITHFMAKKWFDLAKALRPMEEHLVKNMSHTPSMQLQTKTSSDDDQATAVSLSSSTLQQKSISNESWVSMQKLSNGEKKRGSKAAFAKLFQLKQKLYMLTTLGQVYQVLFKNSKYYLIQLNAFEPPECTFNDLTQINDFMISYNNNQSSHSMTNNMTVFHPLYGYNYGELSLIDQCIKQIYTTKNSTVIVLLDDSIDIYELNVDDHMDKDFTADTLLSYQHKMVFWESVLDLASFSGVNANQLLKLRDISCLWASQMLKTITAFPLHAGNAGKDTSLESMCMKKVFQKFLEFLAPPDLIIPFIDHIPPKDCKELVIPYFIEIERFCKNLHEQNFDKCIWKNQIDVDLDFFTLNNDNDEKTVKDLLKLVDTTLFNLYLNFNETLLKPFLRVPNQCDINVVIEKLKAHNKFQDMIDFFYSRKLHKQALEFMVHLEDYVPSIPLDSVMKLVFNYICQLKNENLTVIFEYLEWLFSQEWCERSPTDMCEIVFFQNRTKFDNIKVFEFLHQVDSIFSYQYLEYCVNVLNLQNSKIFFELIKYYMVQITGDQNDSLKEKTLLNLYHLIKDKPFYDCFELLSLLNDKLSTDGTKMTQRQNFILTHCKSLVLKEMNDHEGALKIIINDLDSYYLAAEYINDVRLKDDKENFNKVLKVTFNILVSQDNHKKLLLLLNDFATFFTPIYLLQNLPDDICLQDIQPFLIHNVLFQSKKNCNSTQLEKSLVQVALIENDYQALKEKSVGVSLTETSKCFVCGKLLSPGLIPDGIYYGFKMRNKDVLVHYNCKTVFQKRLDERKSIKKLPSLGEMNQKI